MVQPQQPLVLYETSDGIATVRLNRPERLNAYVPEMGDAIVDAFARARDDGATRAVILTGAGRAFCAGIDLDALRAELARPASATGRRLGQEPFVRSFPAELLRFPKPVIAAVNGPAYGVGVTMILPCDVRIASSNARFGLNFLRLGMLPGLGSTHLLPRIVGASRAREFVLASREIDAGEAERAGLVSRVVPPQDLEPAARELARAMAEADPRAVAAAKRLLDLGPSLTMEEAMENERRESAALRRARVGEG